MADQKPQDDVMDITSVEQFGKLFGIWHGQMMARLRNMRDIPYGTEVTMTDADGKETKVKLKGDGMLGFKAALNSAIAELDATPFVMSLEDAPEADVQAANDAPANPDAPVQ